MWVEILEMFSFVFLISILHHALVLVSLSISSSFYLHRNPFLMLVLLVSSYSKRSQSFVADCLHCSVLHFFLDIHFHLITFSGIRAFVWHFYRFVCVSASWHVSQQIYPSLSLSLFFAYSPCHFTKKRRQRKIAFRSSTSRSKQQKLPSCLGIKQKTEKCRFCVSMAVSNFRSPCRIVSDF